MKEFQKNAFWQPYTVLAYLISKRQLEVLATRVHPPLDQPHRPQKEPSVLVAGLQLEFWRQLYKNRSFRKIDSPGIFSREYDFLDTLSLTEDQFSGKTYFSTIRPWRGVVVAVQPEGERAAADPGSPDCLDDAVDIAVREPANGIFMGSLLY